jgi:hypothetical protein
MLRKTMIVLATATALTGGLTADAFARGGGGFGGGGRGGFVRNPTTLLGSPAPQMPAFQKPESGPTLVTGAGPPRKRAHVTARVPGHDRNRAMTPGARDESGNHPPGGAQDITPTGKPTF